MPLKELQMNWKNWLKIIVLLVFSGLVYFFLKSDFWLVKKIDCSLDGQPCSDQLSNQLKQVSLSKNLIFFPKQNLVLSIKQSNPHIASINIKKRIPDRLIFDLMIRKAVVAVGVSLPLTAEATDSAELMDQPISLSGNFYLIDNQGIILEKTNQDNGLPLIIIDSDPFLSEGEIFDDAVRKAIELLLGLRLRLLETLLVQINSSRQVEVRLKNSTLILFNLNKDTEEQLDSLQLILSRSKIEGKQIKKIDLRFDKPVIEN